jgi:hypothetical protein
MRVISFLAGDRIRQDAWAELTSEQWAEVKRLFMGAARPSCWISRIAKLLDPIAENQAATLTGLESPDGNSLLSSRGLRRDSALYIMDWKTRKAEFLPCRRWFRGRPGRPIPATLQPPTWQDRKSGYSTSRSLKTQNRIMFLATHRRIAGRQAGEHIPRNVRLEELPRAQHTLDFSDCRFARGIQAARRLETRPDVALAPLERPALHREVHSSLPERLQ